ncbi:MAG: YpdA family putative bacillithiol disulfide reductase [Bryobacteraceae bacterium]|nr:YpdA family putative bacillithiol disulfide reductase [Bryobacteraceae bacterium]
MDYDVVIVGAGPTGLACGIELQKLGLRVVLLDKGCVVNSLYHYPTNMVFFTTPELLEIGNIPMTSLNEKPGRTEALKYYRRVAAHYGLDIRQYQHVDRVDGEDNAFTVHAHDINQVAATYSARKVILSTGFYDVPNLLNVPGEDLPKVIHYYKEPHPYYNQDVVIVGAKNSAAIAALELWWSGARVTLVHRGAELHQNIKYWIMPNIANRIKNGEIPAYFNTTVKAITPGTVELATPQGPVTLKNDFVFAMTGYRPDFAFLAQCGVALNPDTQRPDVNSDTLESARKGLYLAGVIVAGVHTSEIFIENGRFHGNQIAAAIASQLKG